jgi:hypothetical protein
VEAVDFPEDGVFDSSRYYITGEYVCVNADIDYVEFHKIQAWPKANNQTFASAFNSNGVTAIFNRCIARCTQVGDPATHSVGFSGTATTHCYACTATGFNTADTATSKVGFQAAGSSEHYALNCVAWDCGDGFQEQALATMYAYNCIAGNCVDDFVDDFLPNNVWNNCSDDGDGINPQTPSGGDWDNEMVDPSNENYNIVQGGNCWQNGQDDPPATSGLYTVGITGAEFTSTWHIGAYADHYVRQGVWIHHYQQIGGL